MKLGDMLELTHRDDLIRQIMEEQNRRLEEELLDHILGATITEFKIKNWGTKRRVLIKTDAEPVVKPRPGGGEVYYNCNVFCWEVEPIGYVPDQWDDNVQSLSETAKQPEKVDSVKSTTES